MDGGKRGESLPVNRLRIVFKIQSSFQQNTFYAPWFAATAKVGWRRKRISCPFPEALFYPPPRRGRCEKIELVLFHVIPLC
jgi:hypothetical protein